MATTHYPPVLRIKRYTLPGSWLVTRVTGFNQPDADILNSYKARTGRNENFYQINVAAIAAASLLSSFFSARTSAS